MGKAFCLRISLACGAGAEWQTVWWTECWCPSESLCWRPDPSAAVLGDGASKGVIRLNEVMKLGPWSDKISVLKEEMPELTLSFHAHAHNEERPYEDREKVAICKPQRELSPGSGLAWTLISDTQSPELSERIFDSFKRQICFFCTGSPSRLIQIVSFLHSESQSKHRNLPLAQEMFNAPSLFPWPGTLLLSCPRHNHRGISDSLLRQIHVRISARCPGCSGKQTGALHHLRHRRRWECWWKRRGGTGMH